MKPDRVEGALKQLMKDVAIFSWVAVCVSPQKHKEYIIEFGHGPAQIHVCTKCLAKRR